MCQNADQPMVLGFFFSFSDKPFEDELVTVYIPWYPMIIIYILILLPIEYM